MFEYLIYPADDPWEVWRTALEVPDGQPTATATRDVADGRLEAQRFGDGQRSGFVAIVQHFPADDETPPRYPTLLELAEAADRLFPLGLWAQFPSVPIGQHGTGGRPLPEGGEPIQLAAIRVQFQQPGGGNGQA